MLALVLVAAILSNNYIRSQDSMAARNALARAQIRDLKYEDAITTLEQVLEKEPSHPEASTLLATANMYASRDFVKSLKRFEAAYAAGGGAAFWVSHSHEKLGTSDLSDYCRGWLYLYKGQLEFRPENSNHGFRLPYSQVKEFAQNKILKRLFHITDSIRTYNFRPRTGEESETILVVALYKKFSRDIPPQSVK
jgi:hypothetical protein